MSRLEGDYQPQNSEPSTSLGQTIGRKIKFAWNLVNPMHGRTTVYVSKQTGEIVRRELPKKPQ